MSDDQDHIHNEKTVLRVLCLHDCDSNALELHKSLKLLDERLYEKHSVELVYINSPLIRNSAPKGDGPPPRIWWELVDEKYIGLDASLLHLRQTWNSMPFSGILAVGQGTTLASLLPLIGVDGLEFGVFLRGKALLEEDCGLLSDWNCLHVMEANNDDSQRLVTQLGGKVHFVSKEGISSRDFNAVGKFIVDQKKRLRRESDSLVIQSQLNRVEQEAARVMAQHVAKDPPKALMAIISPHSVGGWTGKKRREPAEEGGGAPCPSSFVLRKEKRSTTEGAGRQHPNAENVESANGETY